MHRQKLVVPPQVAGAVAECRLGKVRPQSGEVISGQEYETAVRTGAVQAIGIQRPPAGAALEVVQV
jgi:hypothetical protein